MISRPCQHLWEVIDRQGHHETLRCTGCGRVVRVYVD